MGQPPVFIPATSSVPVSVSSSNMSDPFPEIKSKHSLVAKYVTQPIWEKLSRAVTKTSGFSLSQAIACAVQFDNQHCGIYAGDWDSYKVFADVFDPLIQDYYGISPDAVHTSDMDVGKIKGNIDPTAPVHSTRIRVGRSIDGFGLSPGITREQRLGVENLMKKAFSNLKGDLAGTYYPLTGMRAVASSTTRTRPSSPGSMRKISSGSSQCKVEEMSELSLTVLPVASRLLAIQLKLNLERTSCLTLSMVMSTHAQPTWELV